MLNCRSQDSFHTALRLAYGGGEMATYVILSRFSPRSFKDPKEFKKPAEAVSAKIKSECSGVRWKDSYATLGVSMWWILWRRKTRSRSRRRP